MEKFIDDVRRVVHVLQSTAAARRLAFEQASAAVLKSYDDAIGTAAVSSAQIRATNGLMRFDNLEPILSVLREPFVYCALDDVHLETGRLFPDPVDASKCIIACAAQYEFGLNVVSIDVRDAASRCAEWIQTDDMVCELAFQNGDAIACKKDLTGDSGRFEFTFYVDEHQTFAFPVQILVRCKGSVIGSVLQRIGLKANVIKCAWQDARLAEPRDICVDSIPPVMHDYLACRFMTVAPKLQTALRVVESVLTWYSLPYAFVGYNYCSLKVAVMDTTAKLCWVLITVRIDTANGIWFYVSQKEPCLYYSFMYVFSVLSRAVCDTPFDTLSIWKTCPKFLIGPAHPLPRSYIYAFPLNSRSDVSEYSKYCNVESILRCMQDVERIHELQRFSFYESALVGLRQAAQSTNAPFEVRYMAAVALKRFGCPLQLEYHDDFERACLQALL